MKHFQINISNNVSFSRDTIMLINFFNAPMISTNPVLAVYAGDFLVFEQN